MASLCSGLAAQPWWWRDGGGVGMVAGGRAAAAVRETCELLRGAAADVRREFLALSGPGGTAPHTITTSVSAGGSWQQLILMEEGVMNDDACRRCPGTYQLLRRLPLCRSVLGYAYFSVVAPGTEIRPHYGASNCKLRVQLPLVVPTTPTAAVPTLTVHGQTQPYEEGIPMCFDDSYLHSMAMPQTMRGEARAVLLIDLWHPE
eukprot:COSAG01_NODE_22994_length_832_cov_140.416098_2_plen_202_part_01